MRKFLVAVCLFFLVVLSGSSAFGAFPEKPVTLVVPWSAGGVTDTVARAFAPVFEKYLGQPVIVLNKPGASGAIGTEFVYSRPADGYTVLFSAETPGSFRVMGISELSFNDFDPLIMMVYDTKLITVSAKSPYKKIEDLIEDIKARPGKVRMSYSGPGASGHIQGLLLKKVGLDVALIPFGGGNEAMLALLGGQVEFTSSNTAPTLGYIASGDVRVLAVWSDKPVDAFPGVPPITDVLPELKRYFPLEFSNCLLVKKGTPEDVKEVLLKAAKAAVSDPQWIDFVKKVHYVTMHHLEGGAVLDYWRHWESVVSWLLYEAGVAKHSPEKFGIPKP